MGGLECGYRCEGSNCAELCQGQGYLIEHVRDKLGCLILGE